MPAFIPAVAAFALLSAQSATAHPFGPRLIGVVLPGAEVAIVDDRGVEIEGRVQEVSDRHLRLAVRNGSRDIPIEEIVRIERPDGVKNGALTGLGIGVVLGVTSGLMAVSGGSRDGAFIVGSIAGNGLICAGIGALLDAAVDGRKTVYERGRQASTRVNPVVGRGVGGVVVSMSW